MLKCCKVEDRSKSICYRTWKCSSHEQTSDTIASCKFFE